ncbi:MAG: LacI family DNA-binding transcriptional regulator [Blautia sp.]|nr:LacI family DNA-binding transcriptional regulator [Blautia sp.]
MRATIVDIKNRTGLSLATISKYLNGGNVRPENKAKIDEAVEALNYQVNESARSLVTNRTHVIGVVVYTIDNLFVGTMLHHLGGLFRSRGYGMMICDSANDEGIEQENLRHMVQKNVDGVLLMPVSDDPAIVTPLRMAGIPAVCLDRVLEGADCDSVVVNNLETARSLTELLIRNHHERIAMLGSITEYTGRERLKGYREAMEKAGLPIREEYELRLSHTLRSGYDGMQKLLDLPEPPTAIVLSNYEVTMGAIMTIQRRACRYPEDFSLVGIDNLMLAEIVRPRISVAVQPIEEMSVKAAELLLERIEEPGETERIPGRHYVFETQFYDYGSVQAV